MIEKSKWCTLVPFHNLRLEVERGLEFAGGLVLGRRPAWIEDEIAVDRLSEQDRDKINSATYAFSVEYEIEGLDTTRRGSMADLAALANLALWVSQPSPACFVFVIHARRYEDGYKVESVFRPNQLLCHPKDGDIAALSPADVELARGLHSSLVDLREHEDHSAWTAVRAAWLALTQNLPEMRFLLFWIALEALYGPKDGREMTFRLSQRIALFLAGSTSEAKELFTLARKGYAFRSKVAHGQWKGEPETQVHQRMAEVEALVRRSMLQILRDPDLRVRFRGKDRETYLDDLVFSIGGP